MSVYQAIITDTTELNIPAFLPRAHCPLPFRKPISCWPEFTLHLLLKTVVQFLQHIVLGPWEVQHAVPYSSEVRHNRLLPFLIQSQI